jgi:hypothetical protein
MEDGEEGQMERNFEAESVEKRMQLQVTEGTHYLRFRFIILFKRSMETEMERQDSMEI